MLSKTLAETDTKITMPLVLVNGGDSLDKAPLVNNHSVNSFISENNELTVTRSYHDSRKYETMCFKPADKHRVDIVITKGEYKNDLKELPFPFQHFGSQAIRQQYSGKAKCLVGLVFVMLFVMLVVFLLCLIRGQILDNSSHSYNTPDSSLSGNVTVRSTVAHSTFFAENVTIPELTISTTYHDNSINTTTTLS